MNKCPVMTTYAGIPVADNQNSMTAGPRGPLLMQDYQLLEKMAHFNRERVPERVVHAKGSGAYGTFTVTGDITEVHRAPSCSRGRQADRCLRPLLAPWPASAVPPMPSATRAASPSSSTPRKATGTWWATTRRSSSSAIRLKFSRLHPHARSAIRAPTCAANTMRGTSGRLSPETLHQVTILFGDRGHPANYRHMNGYGSHTYSLWNDAGRALLGEVPLQDRAGHPEPRPMTRPPHCRRGPREPSARPVRGHRAGRVPEVAHHGAGHAGAPMPRPTASNPFDLTKVWPHKDYPLDRGRRAGAEPQSRELFRRNRAGGVRALQHACPASAPRRTRCCRPGCFSYADAHRYRIGINYGALPVNKPRCPVHTYHRDGHDALRRQRRRARANYEPNTFGGPVEDPRLARSRRCRSPATPTATTTATATTTTPSRATSSA